MNSMQSSELNSSPSGDSVRKAVETAMNATARGDFEGALTLFRLVQKNGGEIPVRALSYYGLCVVNVERQTKLAVEMAEKARTEEFFDTRHWANLVRIYLAGGSRRRAVAILHEGLDRMPGDSTLLNLRNEIGYRRPSPIPFLHRDNPLNVYLGKRRSSMSLGRTGKIIIGIIWFLALVGLTLFFLMRSSGF